MVARQHIAYGAEIQEAFWPRARRVHGLYEDHTQAKLSCSRMHTAYG